MKTSEKASPVLAKIYNIFRTKNTDDLKIDYQILHDELPDIDPDQIKTMCGYLESGGYITINPDPVHPDIRITPSGVKLHETHF